MGKQTEPRLIESNWKTDAQYHEYSCSKCGVLARNTYVEPVRTEMLERRLCYLCNHWHNFEAEIEKDHAKMTIIDGHVYSPGNRTAGSMRGMAGRRFDIEFIEPSIHAGKRITTFDLWSGATMPEHLQARFPDTAKFLNGAERFEMTGDITGCWNPSDHRAEPYPLPRTLGML